MNSSFFLTMANAMAIGFFTLLFCIICFLVYRKRIFHHTSKVIESSSSSSLSSSPQSLSPTPFRTWRHQVFPSFRGEDVRKNFLSHIQGEFKRKGIVPFIDNEMNRSGSISSALVEAIRESKIAMVLLSKNYASSSWCLNELLEIMKCREEIGQTVMTVFYGVDPSDVRKQTGDFGKAFKKTCVGQTKEVKQKWRQALIDVSNIPGEDSKKWDNEAAMIVKIANDVLDVLNCTPSRDFVDYVGIQSHIRKVNYLLCLESPDVRMIGILGPPGIGKTTIARALFDQISQNFQFFTFIDIRLSYSRYCHDDGYKLEPPTAIINDEWPRKINLQWQLLSRIFKQKDIVVRHLGAVQERLRDHKVLVILDGVDHLDQLSAMAKNTQWFGRGSRIIITTQDQRLLKAHGIHHIYEVGLPAADEALQIFCVYAFGQKLPDDGFEKLAWEVTALAGELPLGLRVLGSYMKGRTLDEWTNALPRLRTSLDGEIETTLRFAYNALSDKDKALFLHIACLFRGYKVDHVKQWLANSDLSVDHGLQVLRQKSLISIDNGFLKMHSLLRQLGVEIVRKQSSSRKPEKREFLVDVNDISNVITKNTGTGNILGIRLNVSKIKDKLVIKEMVFDGMTSLQFLIINEGFGDKLSLPLGLKFLPGTIRLLDWNYCPLRSWPSNFSAEFLVELIMRGNKFEKLWKETLPLQNLKRMELGDSKSLKEIPNLSNATNLEKLDLSYCSGLLELTDSIGKATKLKRLELRSCFLLKKLPSTIGNATSLQLLDLFECVLLEKLPSSIGKLTNLEALELSRCYKLVTLPSSIENLRKLPVLSMSECENLETFPTNINLTSLSDIVLECCTRLKMFPEISTNIKELDLSNTAIENVPSSIRSWSCLKKLDMSGCGNLKEFPNVPDSIVELDLSKTEIEKVPSRIKNLFRLRTLIMVGCEKLNDISPNISKLGNLEDLELTTGGVSGDAASFKAYVEFSDRDDWTLRSDFEVHYILPICLPEMAISLRFFWYDFETIPDCIRRLSGLSELDISGCRNLVALPQLPGSLISLDAKNCECLERIDGSFQNSKICLNFANCINLNQEARKLIQTTACEYALLPGAEVPAHFTHQATSGSLTINMTTKTLPSSFRFKACILLSKDNINLEDQNENSWISVSCHVMGKQNGRIFRSAVLRGYTDHLYIFDYSFSLHEDFPEAKEATFSELTFDFIVEKKNWKVKSCGVHLFEGK